MQKKHPTWQDLQKLGCRRIGYVIAKPKLTPRVVCSSCGQDYYWSDATEEWVHPFEKEFDEYRRQQAKKEIQCVTSSD